MMPNHRTTIQQVLLCNWRALSTESLVVQYESQVWSIGVPLLLPWEGTDILIRGGGEEVRADGMVEDDVCLHCVHSSSRSLSVIHPV